MQDDNAQTRKERLLRLYREAFPPVAAMVASSGGSLEDAKDIFHDTLEVYYEKTVNGFSPQNEKAYLVGMARYAWIKKQERVNRHFRPLAPGTEPAQEENREIAVPRLLRFLERSGHKCMELLQAFYYEKLPVKTLAQRFGFAGERSATVQKHKCLEKVRESVKEKSLQYEDFLD